VTVKPAILLMGPSAAGKTGLAVELVQRLPLSIISVDSAMVYRGMDIGTAKPDAETLARAPHRLIDIREPEQPYSVAEFLADSELAMQEIRASGKIPLLVGGTMMYFHALQHGLSELPSSQPGVREKLARELRNDGHQAMHQRLSGIDPVAAARIAPNDTQRLLRALEVFEISGSPISELQTRDTRKPVAHGEAAPWIKISIEPKDRDCLHQRIAARFDQMLQAGFVEEVQKLMQRPGLHAELPAMRCVGYRQVWNHLRGNATLAHMRERAIIATRQLAKRQLTWLRRESEVTRMDIDPAVDAVQGLIEGRTGSGLTL